MAAAGRGGGSRTVPCVASASLGGPHASAAEATDHGMARPLPNLPHKGEESRPSPRSAGVHGAPMRLHSALGLLVAAALVTATMTQEPAAESLTLSPGQKFAEQPGGREAHADGLSRREPAIALRGPCRAATLRRRTCSLLQNHFLGILVLPQLPHLPGDRHFGELHLRNEPRLDPCGVSTPVRRRFALRSLRERREFTVMSTAHPARLALRNAQPPAPQAATL